MECSGTSMTSLDCSDLNTESPLSRDSVGRYGINYQRQIWRVQSMLESLIFSLIAEVARQALLLVGFIQK